MQGNIDVTIILVGTKSDLAKDKKVYGEAVKEFATKNKISFIETSAKTNLNVDRLFEEVALGISDASKLQNSLTIILADNEQIFNCC